jgi:magnesium chelatase subunit D
VTFSGLGARVVLRPTGSVELARQRLEELPTSGDTPLAEGIHAALDLAVRSATPELQPLVVLVTDGRATAGDDPFAHALAAAHAVAQRGIAAAVVDVEAPGPGRLGLAAELAAAMGARHLPLAELTPDHLEATLRSL